MDYLTIIATRSLVLFSQPPPQPLSPRTVSPCAGSPTTPTAPITPTSPTFSTTVPLPRPGTIALPIHSLLYADTDCAYFLCTLILTDPSMFATTPILGIGGMTKEIVGSAEVMAWKELDKAKMFIRSLGEWFSHASNQRISEEQLEDLAEKWGLSVLNETAKIEDQKGARLMLKEKTHVSGESILLA